LCAWDWIGKLEKLLTLHAVQDADGKCCSDLKETESSGGSSIGGARAPPLLKFGHEKKKKKKKKKNPVKKHYMPNHLISKYTVLTR